MARFDGDSEGQWIRAVDGISDQPTLMEEIRESQREDLRLLKFREQVEAGLRSDVRIHTDGAFYFRNRICVPQGEFRQKILVETHN